jgi:hypothetical protein
MLDSILSSIKKNDFLPVPSKVLVVDDFIPQEAYAQIESTFPNTSPFIHAVTLLKSAPDPWRPYLEVINSAEFYNGLLEKFCVDLQVNSNTLGLRKRDFDSRFVTESYTVIRKGTNIDPLANPQIDLKTMWMLPPHKDSQHTILSLVHFFPSENQENKNGAFRIVKPRTNHVRYFQANSTIPYAYPNDFEIVHEVPYQKNRMVALLNDQHSWHAIGPCDFVRRSVNMSLELQNDGKRTLC